MKVVPCMSLPAWECGLKSCPGHRSTKAARVTPCVGVWIEISWMTIPFWMIVVTPCVGVWIEISYKLG